MTRDEVLALAREYSALTVNRPRSREFTIPSGDLSKLARAVLELHEENERLSNSIDCGYCNDVLRAEREALKREIEEAPVLQGRMLGGQFHQLCVHSVIYEHSVTHTARLVRIEAISPTERKT